MSTPNDNLPHYRVALCGRDDRYYTTTADDAEQAAQLESGYNHSFVQWLGPWIPYSTPAEQS